MWTNIDSRLAISAYLLSIVFRITSQEQIFENSRSGSTTYLSGQDCEDESSRSQTKSASEMISLVSQKPPTKKPVCKNADFNDENVGNAGKGGDCDTKQKLLPSCYYREFYSLLGSGEKNPNSTLLTLFIS